MMWSPRAVISWPDRHPWAAAALALPEKILDLSERKPWVATAFAVPLTMIGLAVVVAYPWLFLPLIVLAGGAVVLVGIYTDQKRSAAAVPEKRYLVNKFEITKDHAGMFWVQLRAATGEIIATSQGHETKAGANMVIQALKTTAPNAKVVDRTQAHTS